MSMWMSWGFSTDFEMEDTGRYGRFEAGFREFHGWFFR